MKKIFLILSIGILMMFTGCGMSGKVKIFKNAPIIELESGSLKSIYNYGSLGTVDEVATFYIETLGLDKENFKIKIETFEPNYCYILTYKWKKQKLEFSIFLDKENCVYAPTYLIDSNNEEHLDDVLNYIKFKEEI